MFAFWPLAQPKPRFLVAAVLVGAVGLSSCSQTKLGEGGSVVTGSGGSAGPQQAAKELQTCEAPIATVALREDPNGYTWMSRYNLPSPIPLVRLLMQQSNCFRVVDRSAGLEGTRQERDLANEGLTREEQTIRRRQVIEAQYSMLVNVTFSEKNAGDSFGGLLAQIPGLGKLAGAAQNVNFKEAQTVLFLTDNETSEQVAAATGSAQVTDIGAGGFVLGKLGGVGAGWSTTNEGKVIAAALLDTLNKMVPQLRVLESKRLPAPVKTKSGGAKPGI